jgi:hypothetical protein
MVGNNNRGSFKLEFPVPATKTFKPEIEKRKVERGQGKPPAGIYFLFSERDIV